MAAKRNTANLAQHTAEHVKAREAARVATVLPPWLGWLAVLGVAIVLHRNWPGVPQAVLVLGCLLAVLTASLTRVRKSALAMAFGPFTLLAAAAWLAWADNTGLTRRVSGVWFMGGGSLALAWSIWLHIRDHGDEAGLARLFADASEHTGVPGLRLFGVKRHGPHKTTATAVHPKGVVAADVIKTAAELDSALGKGLPPGTVQVTAHPDNARWSKITLVNPKTLDTPRLYRPSRPGESIAAPVRYGRWADGTNMDAVVVNDHLMVQGVTGSAKTTAYAWTEIGETVTRHDGGVIVMDLAKGRQFYGPWRPALHKLVTTPAGCEQMWRRIDALRQPRTDHLGDLGLQSWTEGCGLIHLTVFVEEASFVFRAMSDHVVENIIVPNILALRSAGVRVVFMIQRAHFTQMPTTVRSQLSHACLGLKDGDDAGFGLSGYQQDHGCDPGKWGTRKPAMTYMDVPSFDDEYRIMEGRYDYWGPNADLAAAHAAAYPATGRPYDPLTALHMDPPEVSPAAAQARATATVTRPEEPPVDQPEYEGPDAPEPTEWDNPEIYAPDPDEAEPTDYAPPDNPGGYAWGKPDDGVTHMKVTPERARQLLEEWVRAQPPGTVINLRDDATAEVLERIDRSLAWIYPAIDALSRAGLLERQDNPRRYVVRKAA